MWAVEVTLKHWFSGPNDRLDTAIFCSEPMRHKTGSLSHSCRQTALNSPLDMADRKSPVKALEHRSPAKAPVIRTDNGPQFTAHGIAQACD